MIVEHWEQGGLDWVYARLGIPTASQFSRIITPGGKLSAAREGYLGELLAERFTGEPYTEFSTEWTERGQVLEPEAIAFYQFATERDDVEKVGVIFPDEERRYAASPDSLVGDDGGLELKCPALPQHLKYLAEGVVPRVYVPQVQACLYISGRPWWDFMSYHPGFPPLLVRSVPDATYHEALDKHLPAFLEELEAARVRLIEIGCPEPSQ